MHYYTHHIGDYKRDTSHLSLLEHGIYRQLLDLYYLNEKPLDANALRLIGCRSDLEKESAQLILNEFFEKTNEGYVNLRCENELNRIYRKSEKARDSAKARWNNKLDANALRTECEHDANGMRESCEHDARSMLPNTQYPIPNINTIVPSKAENDCPHEKIIELYHLNLPMLTKVRIWNEKRKNALKTRWREDEKRQNLEYWERLFKYIAKSDFLTGRSSQWQCDLEWIVNSTNFIKIIEGKYDNKGNNNG